MKIKQVIDGKDVVGEVSDDTAAFMVDRGYATLVTEDAPETHEVAARPLLLHVAEVTLKDKNKQDA